MSEEQKEKKASFCILNKIYIYIQTNVHNVHSTVCVVLRKTVKSKKSKKKRKVACKLCKKDKNINYSWIKWNPTKHTAKPSGTLSKIQSEKCVLISCT